MSEKNRIDNPYPGLRPFSFADRDLFFGREKQSEELLRRLRRNRFLAVVGTSGSGKSSLVRAGLLPQIDKGFNDDGELSWTVARFRPGKNPIYNMAAALTTPVRFNSFGRNDNGPSLDTDEGQLRATVIETTLRRSAVGLAEHVKRSQVNGRENFLIFIDQFEELFRFKEQSQRSHPEDEAAAFIKLLLEAAYSNNVSVYVLLTMRSDFLGDCAQFRDLPQAINEGQYLIPRMTRDEQRAAITQPAARLGGEMTPRLVQRLLNDVGDNPDHLPLLQHALMRIWERWVAEQSDGLIDLTDYKSIGTLDKALSNHAQETYDSLSERDRRIAERLFKALTETAINNREVRRPAELQAICDIARANVETVSAVIDHFRGPGRSFLMPPPDKSLTGDTIIDISHESLIRGWDLLKRWVEEEARSKAIYQRLADAGNRRYHTDEGASLWRDPDLKFALDWHKRENPNEVWARRYDSHFKEAMDFLDESKREHDREIEREEQERQRKVEAAQAEALTQQRIAEAERLRADAEQLRAEEAQAREAAERENAKTERRRATEQASFARRLKVAVAALIVMFLLASGIAAYAISQKNRADFAKKQAESEKQAADVARNLAIEASHLAGFEKLKAENERQKADEARNDAVAAEKLAKDAEQKAQDRALELQHTLDRLNLATKGKETAEKDKEAVRELVRLERDGLVSLEKSEPEKAIDNFRKLQQRYENDSTREGAIAWSWAWYNYGTAQRQAKNYEEASAAYQGALEKQKALFGPTDLELAPAWEKLAQVRHEQGEFKLSEAAYGSLREILEGAGSKVTVDRIVNVKSDQAKLFHDQARDARAALAEVYRELSVVERTLRFPDAPSGSSESAKPSAEDQQNLEKARLRERELNAKVNELKAVVDDKYPKAESLYKEVVSAREALFPRIHPDLIEAYNGLAGFYQDQAQLFKSDREIRKSTVAQAEADKLYELARVIRENRITPGKNESEKIDVLVRAYMKHDRQGPVMALLTRKLELESAGGPSAETLIALLTSIYKLRQESKAQPYLNQLFRHLGATAESGKYASGTQYSLMSAYPLLRTLIESNKDTEAEKLLQYWLRILDNGIATAKTEPDKKERVYDKLMVLQSAGRMWFRTGNNTKAEQLWNDLLELTGKTFGIGGDWEVWASSGLAALYARQGRDDDALRLFLRLQKMFERVLGPEQRAAPAGRHELELEIRPSSFLVISHSEYLRVLSDLATLYAKRGDNTKAETTYKELLAASEWMMDHPELDFFFIRNDPRNQAIREKFESWRADALEQYATFLEKLGRTDESEALHDDVEEIRERLGPSKQDHFGWLFRP